MAEARFRAMGTDCHVIVNAPDGIDIELVSLARTRVDLLEQCWSRFRPDSDLSLLNAQAGNGPVEVSEDLMRLVQRMRAAWLLSDGLFDPTVISSMNSLGYDTDFATVSARSATSIDDVVLAASPGMSGVHIDDTYVTLPVGVGLDPGAIGKGLAADLVATELHAAGATGVLVNLGGDVSMAGTVDEAWAIGIEDERLDAALPDRTLRVLEFPEGTDRVGVATSTTLKRRWAQGRRHHVIDPRTGSMSSSDLVQATVVASTAWEAEVMATTALLLPATEAATWLIDHDVTGVLLTESAELHTDGEA